jgi:hypothetical protein
MITFPDHPQVWVCFLALSQCQHPVPKQNTFGHHINVSYVNDCVTQFAKCCNWTDRFFLLFSFHQKNDLGLRLAKLPF